MPSIEVSLIRTSSTSVSSILYDNAEVHDIENMLKSGYVLYDKQSNKQVELRSPKAKRKLTQVLAERKARRNRTNSDIEHH